MQNLYNSNFIYGVNNFIAMHKVVCRYYAKGNCPEGEKCAFPHVTEKGRVLDTACRHFLTKKCTFGACCLYDHVSIIEKDGIKIFKIIQSQFEERKRYFLVSRLQLRKCSSTSPTEKELSSEDNKINESFSVMHSRDKKKKSKKINCMTRKIFECKPPDEERHGEIKVFSNCNRNTTVEFGYGDKKSKAVNNSTNKSHRNGLRKDVQYNEIKETNVAPDLKRVGPSPIFLLQNNLNFPLSTDEGISFPLCWQSIRPSFFDGQINVVLTTDMKSEQSTSSSPTLQNLSYIPNLKTNSKQLSDVKITGKDAISLQQSIPPKCPCCKQRLPFNALRKTDVKTMKYMTTYLHSRIHEWLSYYQKPSTSSESISSLGTGEATLLLQHSTKPGRVGNVQKLSKCECQVSSDRKLVDDLSSSKFPEPEWFDNASSGSSTETEVWDVDIY